MKELKKYLYILLVLLLGSFATSCQDSPVSATDDEVVIPINPGSRDTDDSHDDKIRQFRIMIFKPGGDLVHNYYETFADEFQTGDIVKVTMLPGVYDFVFIANEGSDPALHADLRDFGKQSFGSPYSTISDLYGLSFSHEAFDANKDIPMSHVEKNVQVIADETYKLQSLGSVSNGVWKVPMLRLGVRLDLTFTTKIQEKKEAFQKVVLAQIPSSVPIWATDQGGSILYNVTPPYIYAPDRVINWNQGDKDVNNEVWTKTGDTYTWKKNRIIIPSSVFTNPTVNEKRGVAVDVHYTGFSKEGAWLGFKTPYTKPHQTPYDYTLPRNTYLEFIGKIIENKIEFEYIKVNNWIKEPDVPIEN